MVPEASVQLFSKDAASGCVSSTCTKQLACACVAWEPLLLESTGMILQMQRWGIWMVFHG